MLNNERQISSTVIKQVALLAIILTLSYLICSNLSMFIPSVLGAATLYIMCRDFNFYLQRKRQWKPMWASLFILFQSLVVLIIPVYFFADSLIVRIINSQQYLEQLSDFLNKIQEYIYSQTGVDVLSKDNITKIQSLAAQLSTEIVSTTVNMVTIVSSMYFILYFMFANARQFEHALMTAIPFKRANTDLIGQKFRKLVIANAVGIPVVALGQGIVALIGYFIFGAPSPMFLFGLTAIASMIPIVGGAIVYIPVSIFMVAQGDSTGGVLLALYCLVVVGLTDNVLRFTLLKKLEDIHPLNTVFGIIMGMNLFGFMGLVFGPIMVSITVLLIQIYKDEFLSGDDEPISSLKEGEINNQ